MKTLVSIILVVAITVLGFDAYEQRATAQAAPVVLLLAVGLAATGLVIWVYWNQNREQMRWVALEQKDDPWTGDWKRVATNYVMVGRNPTVVKAFPAFAVQANQGNAFFRVVLLTDVPHNFIVRRIPNSGVQPVIRREPSPI